MLSGKKTYIVAAVAILTALVGAWDHQMTWTDAFHAIETAILAATVRAGISASAPKV